MRLQMTQQTQAKVVIGGTLAGFMGLYPGVVEEAWMSVVCGQPLFLVGAFGGAAHAVIDLMQGRERRELTTAGLAETVPNFEAVVELAKHRGLEQVEPKTDLNVQRLDLAGKLVMPDRIVVDFQAARESGLATALNNKLSDAENDELFRSLDPARIAELILGGLSRLS